MIYSFIFGRSVGNRGFVLPLSLSFVERDCIDAPELLSIKAFPLFYDYELLLQLRDYINDGRERRREEERSVFSVHRRATVLLLLLLSRLFRATAERNYFCAIRCAKFSYGVVGDFIHPSLNTIIVTPSHSSRIAVGDEK